MLRLRVGHVVDHGAVAHVDGVVGVQSAADTHPLEGVSTDVEMIASCHR